MIEQFVLAEIMELDLEMASLDLKEADPNVSDNVNQIIDCNEDFETVSNSRSEVASTNEVPVRRSSRLISSAKKRRVSMQPARLDDSNDETEIKNYYLSKRIKRLPNTLETIFEEPKELKTQPIYTSSRKFKRVITFKEDIAAASKLKVKKRQMKAKKLLKGKNFFNVKKLSMDLLLQKLANVESDNE